MTDEKVINGIRSGDEKALAYVMKRYSRMLWKTASQVLGSSEADIEECVADVFITLWQKAEKYEAGRGKLSTWLCTMARNRAVDRLRTIMARKEESMEELPEAASAEDETDGWDGIDECLEQLSGEDREIVKRRYCYEQKPAEIARDMGMDKKKVENRLFRSKQKLKGMMKDAETC
ncbi:MAG: sigma-70 family RNA polymerase sigma factor [Lachnospiraceae bacterium]|nr:sigma-70 family RNA polymerase sigma factor [Lachnospiraceae bacterium]